MILKFIQNKRHVFIFTILVLLLIGGGVGYRLKITGSTVMEDKEEVLFETNMGNIVIELYPDKAPMTVLNFLTYVNDGSYDNTVFHRIIPNFMVQGGGFTETGEQKPTKDPIKLESDNGLKNEIGTIAMARTSDPNSATNQFFINVVSNDFLNHGVRDEGYAVFGKVVRGMDVVNKIASVKTTTKNGMPDWPIEEIKIIRTEIL